MLAGKAKRTTGEEGRPFVHPAIHPGLQEVRGVRQEQNAVGAEHENRDQGGQVRDQVAVVGHFHSPWSAVGPGAVPL